MMADLSSDNGSCYMSAAGVQVSPMCPHVHTGPCKCVIQQTGVLRLCCLSKPQVMPRSNVLSSINNNNNQNNYTVPVPRLAVSQCFNIHCIRFQAEAQFSHLSDGVPCDQPDLVKQMQRSSAVRMLDMSTARKHAFCL
jgi:hypothetical protein